MTMPVAPSIPITLGVPKSVIQIVSPSIHQKPSLASGIVTVRSTDLVDGSMTYIAFGFSPSAQSFPPEATISTGFRIGSVPVIAPLTALTNAMPGSSRPASGSGDADGIGLGDGATWAVPKAPDRDNAMSATTSAPAPPIANSPIDRQPRTRTP